VAPDYIKRAGITAAEIDGAALRDDRRGFIGVMKATYNVVITKRRRRKKRPSRRGGLADHRDDAVTGYKAQSSVTL